MKIDWEAIPCRHAPRCSSCAVGVYHIPEGCNCFPDPVQALCEQHFIKVHSTGPIRTVVSCRSEAETGTDQLESTRSIIREMLRFMGEAFEAQENKHGTPFPDHSDAARHR